MSHYTRSEFQKFIEDDNIEPLIQADIAAHLLSCDECMDEYMSLLDAYFGTVLSINDEFTDTVMKEVRKYNLEVLKSKEKTKKVNDIIYYISAACITLVLMTTGTFTIFNNGLISADKYAIHTKQKGPNFTNGWTDKLTEATSQFINMIENKN